MAADPTGYSLDINSLKRIGRVVREVETNQQLPPTTNRRSRFNGPMVEGIMLENLDGTDDPNVPTKARMQIKTGLQANDEWADDPQPSILTIWNRTTTAVSIDQVVFAKELYPDRWHLIVGGGGGGSITIRFRIVAAEAYCMDCYATARIISGPPEVTDPDSLPGTTYNYEAQYYTIRVYDMGEGWLNHPPEDLLNMIGHATWLRSYEDGPCAEEPSLHWEIIDMQDPEIVVCE